MKEVEWENSIVEGGPEVLLDNLLKSGYPWHALGQRLKIIDQQFRSVTEEYAQIQESIDKLTNEVDSIRNQHSELAHSIPETVRVALKEEAAILQNRWLIGAGSLLIALLGLVLSVTGNAKALEFLKQNGPWVGVILIILAVISLTLISKKDKRTEAKS